jgi:hypothetical protein
VKSSNGDTRVGTAAGDLRVSAANGGIAGDVAKAGLGAKSANGDVRLGEAVRGSVVLETHAGDVEVGIREGTAAYPDVRSPAGRVLNGSTRPMRRTVRRDRRGARANVDRRRRHPAGVTDGRGAGSGAPGPPVAVLARADLEEGEGDRQHGADADEHDRDRVGRRLAAAGREHDEARDDEDDGGDDAARAHGEALPGGRVRDERCDPRRSPATWRAATSSELGGPARA